MLTIKRMPVLVPPLIEQNAIVRFLHHADRQIRRYIRAKQQLIKLLEEEKSAISAICMCVENTAM
jgi:type I restriction enzyme, S subunit